MDRKLREAVQAKLTEAYKLALIKSGLKGGDGGEPQLRNLEYEFRTLFGDKQAAFLKEFFRVALDLVE